MRLPRIPISKEAIPLLSAFAALTVVVYILAPLASIIPLILFVLIAFFFRDPERHPRNLPGAFISPADGTVTEVNEVFEGNFLNSGSKRVSIFLSILDVHVIRSPSDGKVEYTKYEKGKFLPAFYKQAPHENERNLIGIRSGSTEIMVTMIAGIIARRIVCYIKKGDTLVQGQRIGVIKFGSGADIFMPASTEVTVRKGQKVKAGETIIGRLKTEQI